MNLPDDYKYQCPDCGSVGVKITFQSRTGYVYIDCHVCKKKTQVAS